MHRQVPSPAEQAARERETEEFFARFRREEERRREEAQERILATLAAGKVVREIWGNSFTDWTVAERCKAPGREWGFDGAEGLTAHLLNRHVGFRTVLQFDPVIRCIPLDASEAVAAAKADGYTHVKTFGGWLPIDEWATGRVRYNLGHEYRPEERRIREVPLPDDPGGCVLGLWPVGTEADTLTDLEGIYRKEEAHV